MEAENMADTNEYRRLSDGFVIELTDVQFESVKDLFASVEAPVGLGSPLQQQRERVVAQQIRDETLAYIETVAAAEKKAKEAKDKAAADAARRDAEQAANVRVAAASKKLEQQERGNAERSASPATDRAERVAAEQRAARTTEEKATADKAKADDERAKAAARRTTR
jgi:hypothetical protein